jgi:hypothetical protein
MIATSARAEYEAAEAAHDMAVVRLQRAKQWATMANKARAVAWQVMDRQRREEAQRQADLTEAARQQAEAALYARKTAIFAHWQSVNGRIGTWQSVGEAHFAAKAVKEMLGKRSQAVPTFEDWARQQNWSENAVQTYERPTMTATYRHLGLPIEAFRELLLAKMRVLHVEQRGSATVSWKP